MKKIFKLITVFIFYLLILELLSRVFFPDFQGNNIFYDIDKYHRISKGKNAYFQYMGKAKIRVKSYKDELNFKSRNTIWIAGDSITNGYGLDFNQTYYFFFSEKLKKMNKNYNIIPSGMYGASFQESFSNAKSSFEAKFNPGDIFIYQFNYNDINNLAKEIKNIKVAERRGLINFINDTNKFRYKYLNHSNFFKILQHYASIIVRKTNGNCKKRGLDALGPYTYTFFHENYKNESKKIWNIFKKEIIELNNFLIEKKIKFYVLIPPISLQIPGHEKINKLNYTLECSTKNPRKYLTEILKYNDISYIDATENFINFYKLSKKILFHQFDTNHPNELGHLLIGEAIFNKIK